MEEVCRDWENVQNECNSTWRRAMEKVPCNKNDGAVKKLQNQAK